MVRAAVPSARTLIERFCPDTGAPLRVGQVWPPRLVLHNVSDADGREEIEIVATVWVRHLLREAVEFTIHPSDEPAVDSVGSPGTELEFAL